MEDWSQRALGGATSYCGLNSYELIVQSPIITPGPLGVVNFGEAENDQEVIVTDV